MSKTGIFTLFTQLCHKTYWLCAYEIFRTWITLSLTSWKFGAVPLLPIRHLKIWHISLIFDAYDRFQLRCDRRRYCLNVRKFSHNYYDMIDIPIHFIRIIEKKNKYSKSKKFGVTYFWYPTKNFNLIVTVEDIMPE